MKKVLSALFFVALMTLTFYIVFQTQDLGEVLETIAVMNKAYLALAIFTAFFFVAAEGILFFYMFRSIGDRVGFLQCIKYAFIGFFYCGVTPSATGGQPMQLFHMQRDGHKVADSTVVLISAATAYKIILVVMGIGIAVFWWGGLKNHLGMYMPLYFVGLFLNAALVALLLAILLNGRGMEKILLGLERFAVKIHILKHSEKRIEKMEEVVKQYRKVVLFLKTHLHVVLFLTVVTFIQRCSVFGLTYFIYRGMGLSGAGLFTVMALQAVVYITVDMLPLPGSQGITELVYTAVFGQIFVGGTLTISMCVTRGINFYLPFIVSAVVAGISFFHKKKGKQEISQ
ncbi:MAG: YbhN family protein [Lachnospiraceae bacterium]